MNKESQSNNEKNMGMALSLASDKLKRQNEAHKSLDQKVGYVLAFIGAIAGSAILLLKQSPSLFGINLFTVGLMALLISLVLIVFATATRGFLDPPRFEVFYSDDALASDNLQVKNQVVSDMKSAYESNDRLHLARAFLFNSSLYLFGLSIFFIFLGILEGGLK